MEKILNELLTEVKAIKTDIGGLKEGQCRMESDIGGLKEEVKTIKTDIGGLKEEVKTIKKDIGSLKEGQHRIEIQVLENTQILKALEHTAQVNKAEHDNMINDIAEIKGEMKGIRNNVNTVELVTSQNWNELVKLKSVK